MLRCVCRTQPSTLPATSRLHLLFVAPPAIFWFAAPPVTSRIATPPAAGRRRPPATTSGPPLAEHAQQEGAACWVSELERQALLRVKLTRHRCGRLLIGVICHHRISDGHTASTFCAAWASAHASACSSACWRTYGIKLRRRAGWSQTS
jgi:hypothetical protein